MNRPALRALATDAFLQVLDNWVFRILVAAALLPVAATFLVGLREDGIVLLFGLKTWSYSDLFGGFTHNGLILTAKDQQWLVIEVVLQVVIKFLAGSLAMILALAATAFFVPRMLEKGAADLYFHKPVSRWALFFSRYCAGLFFITLVAVTLVGGMYLGLLIVSRHNDPAILVAAPALIYVFALIYSFSLLVGVVAKSSAASLLLSSLFFSINGCIQQSWIGFQQQEFGPGLVSHREDSADPPAGAPATDAGEAQDPGEEGAHDRSAFVSFMLTTLDVVHYVLPKTSDADVLAEKARKTLAAPVFSDPGSLVAVFRLRSDLEPASVDVASVEPALRAALGEPRFAVRDVLPPGALHGLWRRPLTRTESRIGERVRVRRETASQAAESLEDALRSQAGVSALERASKSISIGSSLRNGISAWLVTWKSAESGAVATRSALLFRGADDEFLYTLVTELEGDVPLETLTPLRERLTDSMGIDEKAREDWYPSQLGFSAPLPYNIFFSVGSSLAFAAALLLVGGWHLARIDF